MATVGPAIRGIRYCCERLIEEGAARVEIAEVLPLTEVQQVLGLGKSRHVRGKVVLMAGR